MLSITELQFEVVEQEGLTAYVGQLCATETAVLATAELNAHPDRGAAANAIMLQVAAAVWRKVYGELGELAKELVPAARESGDIRVINLATDLLEMLTPKP